MTQTYNRHLVFILCSISLFFSACSKELQKEVEVLNLNFDSTEVPEATNLKRSSFFDSNVAGFYNNEELSIHLDQLPPHQVAIIQFDLYIHNTWDGSVPLGDGDGGPDIWSFSVDGENYIRTTFSNAYCPPGQHCSPQSYPLNFPNNTSPPKSGVFKMLPGVCSARLDPEGTAWYKISKTIKHSKGKMTLSFKDELAQSNHSDTYCDESWSIDNLRVRVIQL